MESSTPFLSFASDNSLWNGTCTPENTLFVDAVNADDFLYSDLDIMYISVVLPIVAALAIITNGSYLFVVAKIKSMRTVTNVYLANLAVADLIFSLTGSGGTIRLYNHSGGVRGNVLPIENCAVFDFFIVTSNSASIMLVLAVTLDRYYAVCYPLEHRTFTKTRTVKIAIATWSIGALIFLPVLFNVLSKGIFCVVWPDLPKYSMLPPVIGFCSGILPEGVDTVAYNLPVVVLFVFAMAANSFMYFKIIQALKNRPAQRDNQRGLSDSAERTRRRVTRMLLANTLVFFALTLPNNIRWIMIMTAKFIKLPWILEVLLHNATFYLLANSLSIINSIINPIIYNATNSRYRQAYREAFLPCRRRRTP